MHRLFVALVPPRIIRERLLALMGGIAGVHWQGDHQLHITLRFIGEVDGRIADDITAALATIVAPPLTLSLGGPGTFDRDHRVDTIWAGIQPHEPITILHRKIDRCLERVGIAPETRAYLPHITLARVPRRAPPPDPRHIAALDMGSSPAFTIDHFGLYESLLSSDGAHYMLVERYPLIG